jgi:hypothetical protein
VTKSIEEYLRALRSELKGSDAATIQDALADAEEHLRTALESLREKKPDLQEAEALAAIVEQYGSPEETAAAYVEVERRTPPGLGRAAGARPHSPLERFFGVYGDPRAWGALLYLLIALVTGTVYFSWAVTGLSLSISFALFIFGLPFAVLFLLSVRGVALLEGRLVEALLGVRMPRRPLFAPRGVKWQERIRSLLLDKHTWLALTYLIMQLPLGIFYFLLVVISASFSISGIAVPILQWTLDMPVIWGSHLIYKLPVEWFPLMLLGGILLWTGTMHLVKWIGWLHGRLAKIMLVAD